MKFTPYAVGCGAQLNPNFSSASCTSVTPCNTCILKAEINGLREREAVGVSNFRDAMKGITNIRIAIEETFGGLQGTHVQPDVLLDCKEVCDAIYAAYRNAGQAKSMGCQPEKVVICPTTECIGWVKEAIEEHDEKWKSALEDAGVKYETTPPADG